VHKEVAARLPRMRPGLAPHSPADEGLRSTGPKRDGPMARCVARRANGEMARYIIVSGRFKETVKEKAAVVLRVDDLKVMHGLRHWLLARVLAL
jgi:hypothetical protein